MKKILIAIAFVGIFLGFASQASLQSSAKKFKKGSPTRALSSHLQLVMKATDYSQVIKVITKGANERYKKARGNRDPNTDLKLLKVMSGLLLNMGHEFVDEYAKGADAIVKLSNKKKIKTPVKQGPKTALGLINQLSFYYAHMRKEGGIWKFHDSKDVTNNLKGELTAKQMYDKWVSRKR